MNEPIEDMTADASGALRLGPFPVSAKRSDVEAFRAATGWHEADLKDSVRVPHTFPMLWLSGAELRAAIEAKVQSLGGIAIHESQTFTYQKPLDVDRDYLLSAEIETHTNPDRLSVRVSVSEMNDVLLDIETILRVAGVNEPSP